MRLTYQRYLFWSVLAIALFSFLQGEYSYMFYYQEQLVLFLFSKEYAWNIISAPGGLADYIANFLQQFYGLHGIGALCTTLLLVSCGHFIRKIMAIRTTKDSLLPDFLALCPLCLLLNLHIDENYQIAGTISFLFCLFAWFTYFRFDNKLWKIISPIVFTTLLYWMAGPAFSLFTCGIIICALISRRKHLIYAAILSLLTALSWILMANWQVWQGEISSIVFPDIYYEHSEETYEAYKIYYPWILTIILLLFVHLIQNKSIHSWKITILSILIVSGSLSKIYLNQDKIRSYAYERDYYLRHQQWEKIISSFSSDKATIPTMNVLNLALACQHELGDRMFAYPQNGPATLISSWDGSLMGAIICSDIFYQIGDIASAQKFAFEGLITSTKGNPRLLKRLVETNIICGNYAVADKYIHLLEQTYSYKEWASSQRFYLSDEKVEKQKEYAAKRKAWEGKDGNYAVSENLLKTLEQITVNNPNPVAFQYLSGFYLLNRNLSKFKQLYNRYYHSPIWPELTIHQQEAMIALEQSNPENWARSGVSLRIEQTYGAFSQDMAEKHNFLNFTTEMEKKYGNTYWFYLLFKK